MLRENLVEIGSRCLTGLGRIGPSGPGWDGDWAGSGRGMG